MPSVDNLNVQSKEWFVIIGKNHFLDIDLENKVLVKLTQFGLNYCCILHDKCEYKHYHFVVWGNKRLRKSQVIKLFCDLFTCIESNVQVSKCLSIVASIQYLTHKNQKNKESYDFQDIRTNISYDYLVDYYNEIMNDFVPTTQGIIDLVCRCNCRTDLIRTMGITIYNQYRYVIKDLITELDLPYPKV